MYVRNVIVVLSMLDKENIMYNELSNAEKNNQARNYCRVMGNTPIKGIKTTDSKVINGGTLNHLLDTGIESRGFIYQTKVRGKFSKTIKLAVTKE